MVFPTLQTQLRNHLRYPRRARARPSLTWIPTAALPLTTHCFSLAIIFRELSPKIPSASPNMRTSLQVWDRDPAGLGRRGYLRTPKSETESCDESEGKLPPSPLSLTHLEGIGTPDPSPHSQKAETAPSTPTHNPCHALPLADSFLVLMILAAYSWPVQSLTQRRTTEKAPLERM